MTPSPPTDTQPLDYVGLGKKIKSTYPDVKLYQEHSDEEVGRVALKQYPDMAQHLTSATVLPKEIGTRGLPVAAPLKPEEESGFGERRLRDVAASIPPVFAATAAYRGVKGESPFDPRSGYGKGAQQIQESLPAFFNPRQAGIQRGITGLIKGTGEMLTTPGTVGLLGSSVGTAAAKGLPAAGRHLAETGVIGGTAMGLESGAAKLAKRFGAGPETQEMVGTMAGALPIATLGFKPEWALKPAGMAVRGAGKVLGSTPVRAAAGLGIGELLSSQFGIPRVVSDPVISALGMLSKKDLRKAASEKAIEFIGKAGRSFRGEPVEAPVARPNAPGAKPSIERGRPGPVSPPGEKPKSNYSGILDTIDEQLREKRRAEGTFTGPAAPTAAAPSVPGAQAPPSPQMALPFEGAPPLPRDPEQMRLFAEPRKPLGEEQLTETQQTQRTAKANKLARYAAIHMPELTEREIKAKAEIREWRKALGQAAGVKYIPSKDTILHMIPTFVAHKKKITEMLGEATKEFSDKSPDVVMQPFKSSEEGRQ
jgi:hypothetical protein